MNPILKLFLTLLLLSVLAACAPVDYSQEKVFPEVQADTALIYFYRPPGFVGSTYRFKVNEGNEVVGAMAQDSYFYVFATPGEHTYSVDDRNMEKGSFITLNVEAGKTYYIKVDVEYEVLGGKPLFSQVNKEEAMKLLPSRKYVVPAKINASTYNVYAE